jgi:hypothetical protein
MTMVDDDRDPTPDDEPEDNRDPIMDDPEESRRMAKYWKGEITAVDQVQENWYKRGAEILKRYRDERTQADQSGQRRLNLLWSSVQILKPAVYAKVPQAVCERKFQDKDPIGRVSATILERALRNELQENGFHPSMRRARDDYLLPGRGQLWVRYEPEIGEGLSVPTLTPPDVRDANGEIEPPDESDDTEKLEETGSQILSESAPVDYVHWKDFLMFPSTARTWEEVLAVGKRVFTSKTYNIERFGEEIGRAIKADPQMTMRDRIAGENSPHTLDDHNSRKRIIYEIWNKADRKVYWVSTGYEALCDCRQDPLGLRNFFPCPEPLSATMTNDSLVPVPDFTEYQDQANQVDELTQRISLLAKALKVAGCYDAANRPLRRLLDETTENELIPVEGWAQFAQKGGLQGAIAMLPIKEVMETLQGLTLVRAKVLEDFDRVTGISALVSQTNDARETLGGQRLKSNGGQTRIEDRRNEVGRFAQDVVRLVAEVIAKHFQPATLIEISGILYEEGIDPASMQPVATDAPPIAPPMPGMAAPAPGLPGMPPQLAPPIQPPGAPMAPLGPIGAPPHIGMPMAAGQPPGMMSPAGMPPAPGTGVVPFRPPMAGPPPGMPPQMPVPMPGMMPPPPGGGIGMPATPPGASPLISPRVLQVIARIKKAIDLLKSDIPRGYRIDIETDTMIAGDVQQERQDATEFITAVTKFLETAQMLGAQNPAIVPLLAKMLQWGVRKFRTGRDLESAIDEYADKAEKLAQSSAANMAGHPNPEAAKGAADAARAQAEIAKAKIDQQSQMANDQRDQTIAAQNHQADMEKLQLEMTMMRERHAFDMQKLAAERMQHASEMGMPAPTMQTASAQGYQDNVRSLADAADKIHRAARTKKRVVYGVNGRPTGVEPVPEDSIPGIPGSRQAPDGNHYVPNPSLPGKYMKVIRA